MHFYHIGYEALLRLPIYTFWELSRNADRIRAEEDLRQLNLYQGIFGEADKIAKQLQADRGEVVEIEYPNHGFDRAGFEQLRMMMGKGAKP